MPEMFRTLLRGAVAAVAIIAVVLFNFALIGVFGLPVAVASLIYRFWLTIFAMAFGVGVVTGIVLSFEFGLGFAGFAQTAGPAIGPPGNGTAGLVDSVCK